MYLALWLGYKDIAAMLERKGAKCTKEEIRLLGKEYTDFISSITAEEQTPKEGPSKQKKVEENAAKQGNGKGERKTGKGN